MAPRKRTGGGAKKSDNQNQNQQSQLPKYGIQHFFDQHSQSQKALSQNSSKNNSNLRNPISDSAIEKKQNLQISPKDKSVDPILNKRLKDASVEAKEPRSLARKIDSVSKYLRGGSTNNVARSSKIDVNNGVSGHNESRNEIEILWASNIRNGDSGTSEKSSNDLNMGVVPLENIKNGGNLRESDLNNQSQNTPYENILPVEIDDVENQLEVSPEACKSSSVKRFKFSPGMLIKQSQDDGGDEVTWRISPVNERLHAMSKHFPGMIKVLAESSRLNSMNFQQCSQKKVLASPGESGNLEKWLCSPPQKAAEKSLICSDRVTLRKVNSDRDVDFPGSNGTNSKNNSNVFNSQSPFNTPPSLSFCHDKAADGFDSSGVPDEQGSRQHKKALIEILDQVEDVISVEESVCKDEETFLEAERCPEADLAVNQLTINSNENINSKASNCYFLVLEVSEKHGSTVSSGPHFPYKVLRLLNEQSGEERAVQLWDEWFLSVVAPGDTVHVIGEFDGHGKCDVNRENNFLIVHPNILVSGTRVASSFSCPRRAILDERLKCNEHSAAALMGTLLHQIFQVAGLIKESPTKEFLEGYARIVIQKNLENLYACGVDEIDTQKTLFTAIPKILNWIASFRDSQDFKSPSIDFKCGGLKKIKISEVIDIEEMAWAPKYGLKGMIDASVQVRIESTLHEAREMIMPLEFKTGKGNSGQTTMEHNAQVMLYALLMSERYMKNIECGLLYYLHTDQTQGISVRRSDLVGLIMRRNELANDLLKALTAQQLPPMLQSPNMCKGCRHLSVCSVYHKVYGGTTEGSGLGDVFDSMISHLTTAHTDFLKRWERLVDLEAKALEVANKESWCSQSIRNDHSPTSLSSLVLDTSDKPLHNNFFKGNKFVYRFVRGDFPLSGIEEPNRDSLHSTSSLDCTLRMGDYVILSIEPGCHRVAKGVIVDVDNSHVSVSFTKHLRLPGSSRKSATQDLHQRSWRIDKDEVMSSFAVMRFNLVQVFLQNEHSSHLRKMIVDLEMPRFDSGCIFSQDPAFSYVWSEKSLNDDQRRAILKILTAKNYALILGMPGTGKTSTMVHAVKALLMRGASILLTSYTNSAVDNLLIKLRAQGVDFIRIGRDEAVHTEVQGNCISAMKMDSTQEIKLKLDQIKVVAVTCLGINNPLLTNKRFDVCIMDEAGQITLPVSLGPLMLASKFVLVGDHYQLPPLVQSPVAKESGMAVSLFCRLSEAHPQAIAALHSQYRMCAAIMELSNALIYGNRLRCGSSDIENAKLKYTCKASAPSWLEVLNPKRPVIFINTDLLPTYETTDHKAVNNPIEAYIIAEVTKALLLRGIRGEDIGIITPYNSQSKLIQEAVSAPVEIHTIDKYQGRDKDCILVSFVRSSQKPGIGTSSLLGDWHRINVALTRAKKKLIMVGSCRSLSKVPLLKLLIEKVEEQSGMLIVSDKDFNINAAELKRCSNIKCL
ncbi:DNA replication ATP-dependent helicase/nuclease DNA2 isoform X3 [Olea europaea var. sylvestris]|uniref:DNA replication ATP-dependent helicase/nuclease DNA2 isoform X3 n=1 Tax=Olea europaea var. sylvestris TaxID=158386 RepID=UPI000C1D8137|nr:DNA replication ATP-dependent helicase/nuclease DNA2 isoform X3 [Olea europaea var. sylvestris]